MTRKHLALCVLLAYAAFPIGAQAGILSSLGNEANSAMQQISGAILQVESEVGGAFNTSNILGILQTGKVITTGANQQMQANLQQQNQKLQETAQLLKDNEAAQAANNYAEQTSSVTEPLGCSAPQAAAGYLMASTGASAQSAGQVYHTGGFVGGDGAAVGQDQQPGNQAAMAQLSAQTGNTHNAGALFASGQSGNQPIVEHDLLDPVAPQPLQEAAATTAAGQQYLAAWNRTSSALSLASEGLATVGGLHAFTVPQSAVNSAAQSVGATPSAVSGATAKPVSSAPGATKNPPAQGGSGGGNWKSNVPVYASQVAQAAASHNVPPAILAAIVAQEDGTENLKALAMCGTTANGSPYNFNGVQSVRCVQGNATYTAKGLTQMIDTTAQESGLPSPMEGTTSVTAELSAAATHLQSFMAACRGSAACVFGAWNYGSVAPGMPQGNFTMEPNENAYNVSGYVQQAMSRYTGKSAYNVNMYNGGSGALATGASSSGPGASSAGLLRLSSYASYANPAWYQKLYVAPPAGVWRSIAYLMALQNVVVNQNRQIMERLSAVMAERLALTQQAKANTLNDLRGAAMAQYANEPLIQKIWEHL